MVAITAVSAAASGFALGLVAYAQFDADPLLDPVKAAPHIFEVAFENEFVRVIKTTARPGQISPLHSHPGRAAIFLEPCIDQFEKADGAVDEVRFDAGAVVWAAAQTHGGEPYTFAEECVIMEVEVKAAAE